MTIEIPTALLWVLVLLAAGPFLIVGAIMLGIGAMFFYHIIWGAWRR
jgi:hypothetical protein